MSVWHPVSERPPKGSVIACLDQHRKGQGWLSAELNFGVVYHDFNGGDRWWVENNDDRGYGTETWEPESDASLEGFQHWAYVSDLLPALPERT